MNYADKKESGEVKDLEMAEQQLRNIHANAADLLKHLEEQPCCPLLSQGVGSVKSYPLERLRRFSPRLCNQQSERTGSHG